MRGVFTRGGWGMALLPVAVVAALGVFLLASDRDAVDAPPRALPRVVAAPTFENLPPSGAWHDEIWARNPSGGEFRVGAFRVLEGGSLVTLAGDSLVRFDLADLPLPGSEILVTVERGGELAGTRSDRVLLRGTLEQTEAELTAALPDLAGNQTALLAASTRASAPLTAGVWFAASGAGKGSPAHGLSLPARSDGWTYGGWVRTGSVAVLPTGLFSDPNGPDDRAPYSGSEPGWNIPGEDFLENAPDDLSFPLNLADGRSDVIVSLEPADGEPAEYDAPFLPLLSARIPYRQKPNSPVSLTPRDAESFPRGRVVFQGK